MVIWLNGLSGSGKSTVGLKLYDYLKKDHENLVFLDGDILREVWADNLGHTVESRSVNATRISKLCEMLDNQGIHIIASVMHMFPDWQDWYRKTFSVYFEVFLDVPFEVLRQRDKNGLYSQAEAGTVTDVVGIDLPFPKPEKSEVVFRGNDSHLSPDEMVERIVAALPLPLK